MDCSTPREVVSLIRANVLRIRIGLWLIPASYLGQERNEAARFLLEGVDIRQELVKQLPVDARFAGLNSQKVIDLIDAVTQQKGTSDCALIYNLDLLLSRLSPQECEFVWQLLLEAMPHRPRAILITMPASATDLLPSLDQLNQWAREKRLASSPN